MNNFNQDNKIRIVSLLMFESGTYQQQFIRPYETDINAKHLNILTDRVMQSPNKRITGSMLSDVVGGFIRPMAAPEAPVNIVNGWGEKRIRFVLQIENHSSFGSVNTQYIQGYTNFYGISASKHISPDMEFYVNSVINTRQTNQETPLGNSIFMNVSDNSHIVADNGFDNVYQPTKNHMMRPQDVFTKMSVSHLGNIYGNNNDARIEDTRLTLRRDAQKSTRASGLPSTYAATIIDGYSQATSLLDFNQSEEKLLESAKGYVIENEASLDPFLSAISNFSGNLVGNTFTHEMLRNIDPNVVNVSNLFVLGPTQMATVSNAGSSCQWDGTNLLTQAATMLSQALPAIMMDLMISKVFVQSTNHDMTGQMRSEVLRCESFCNGRDMRQAYNLFVYRLENEILKDITNSNQISYTLQLDVDLFGETKISISLDSSGVYDFVTPSFCDNLFVPVITRNVNTLDDLSRNFETLSSHISDAVRSETTFNNSSIITNV